LKGHLEIEIVTRITLKTAVEPGHTISDYARNVVFLSEPQVQNKRAYFFTLRVAGLFSLPIPLRFAFGIGVSQMEHNTTGLFEPAG
jgi:hypothetical protein